MAMQVNEAFGTLTDKEKQTLRLIVRGHDAKSIARSLGLSVHTINERLRDARRKMEVSSSREAARLLLEAEGGDATLPNPDLLTDTRIGEDGPRPRIDQGAAPIGAAWRTARHPLIISGVILMTFILGLLALATLPQAATSPATVAASAKPIAEVVATARQWLELVDRARWDESYQATGAAFRKLNTAQVWADTSEKVRTPLGAVLSRAFVSEEELPAPPAGYEVVKFRTRFANKAETIETVTLERESGSWRVVGVMIG